MMDMHERPGIDTNNSIDRQTNKTPRLSATMRRYRGWSAFPVFLSDCAKASATDVLVTPPVAAAILSYSRARMTRLLDQEEIVSWAWYEPGKFHASELFVSVQSLVIFGLHRGRLGSYDSEIPLQAVIDRSLYEQLSRDIAT